MTESNESIRNSFKQKYKDAKLFDEHEKLYDYLIQKEGNILKKLDKVIQSEENIDTPSFHVFNTIVFKMYENCKDTYEDILKKKPIYKIMESQERKIYVGITIISFALFLMLFYM